MTEQAPAAPGPDAGPPDAGPPGEEGHHEETQRGTMFITLLFLAGTAAVWLWTYFTFIGRG
jgi:hypothetical protein